VTAITSFDAGSVAHYSSGRYGSTPTPNRFPVTAEGGQAVVSIPPDETGLPAPSFSAMDNQRRAGICALMTAGLVNESSEKSA
jgi:hypothetical protein